jgi:PAS domain S-box-containing protein
MNQKLTEHHTTKKLNINYLKSKVLDESINAIAIIDLNWNFVYVNKSFLKFWHYNNFNEVIGKNALKFGGGSKERSRFILSKILARGFTVGEHRFKTREGELFMGQMSGTLIKNVENEPKWILLEFVDITERKLIEKKLMESEDKFRNIAEQSLMGIGVVQDGLIKYANETLAKIIGYSTKEMMNWPENEFKKLFHPESVEFVMEQAKKKQLGEEDVVRNYQFRIIMKTGNVKWIENYSQSTPYEGKFADLVSWIDITDRRKAEALLKESEHNLKERVKELTCLYGISDLAENPDTSTGELIQGVLGLIPPAWQFPDITCARITLNNVEYKTENFKITEWKLSSSVNVREKVLEIEVYYLEDKPFLEEERSLIKDIGNRLKGYINNKEAEQKLKESEQNYREAFGRTTFYKDLITHDMNNILQVIQLTLEISSLDKNISLDLKESLESIKNQVIRGSKLISNVQKLSQLEESQKHLKNVVIYDVLKVSLNFLKKSFTLKKINVKVDTPRKNYLVKANNILREVFENILINAVKYNENSTVEILIRFSEEQKEEINYIKVEFMDNGRGIPDSIKKVIFHKGFLEEKKSEGMGIGLTLVKKAIETYNGQIWVEDRITGDYSKGSNFILIIPKAA